MKSSKKLLKKLRRMERQLRHLDRVIAEYFIDPATDDGPPAPVIPTPEIKPDLMFR